MEETHILLVRHPETTANIDGRYVGTGDAPYTREGQLQVRRIAQKIARFEPQRLWTSPLRRTLVAARRAAAQANVPAEVDDRLVELDFGIAEGLTFAEVQAAGILFNYKEIDTPVAPQGETRRAIEARSAAFCDDIITLGGRHAVVTHGGVFRASLVHLLGLSSTDIWAFHIHNAQMAHVRIVEGHGMLEEYRVA